MRGLILLWVVLCASPAWAVQSHGGVEGLVSHEIGHILFTIGMTFLLFRLLLEKLPARSWRMFKYFLIFIILWNILTFVGHMMNEMVDTAKIIKSNGHAIGFWVESLFDLFYYMTRLDHILLVPAFIFLYISLGSRRKAE
jgi:hypothetical protein